MEFLKKHIIFFVLIAIGLIAFIAFGFLYYNNQSSLNHAQTELEKQQKELKSLLAQKIAPTRENRVAMEEYSNEIKESFAHYRDEILRTDLTEVLFEGAPESPQKFAFSHLSFREELKREAREQYEIELASAVDHFGFSLYSRTPPSQELLEPLYQQRQIIHVVLDNLFRARPGALLFVKRGVVRGENLNPVSSDSGRQDSSGGENKDTFSIPKDISVRVPDIVDTIPVQVVFIGRTVVLRDFLNNLVESKYPIAVRNVEVRSLAQRLEESSRNTRRTRGAENRPEVSAPKSSDAPAGFNVVIAENYSEFTVTLEYLVPASSAKVK